VIAPSPIPTAPGDRVKTDFRDCRRLGRLHRAGAQGGQDPLAGLGQGGRGRVKVLVVIVSGQHLDRIPQP
jgi:hypothetical protein